MPCRPSPSGPRPGGAGRGAAAKAGPTSGERPTRQVTARRRIMLRAIYRRRSLRPALGAQARRRAADTESMRRALALTSTAARRALRRRGRPGGAARACRRTRSRRSPVTASWADTQIRAVTAVGDPRRRSGDIQADRAADPGRAGGCARGLGQAGSRRLPIPTRLVTMRELDAQLVGALGLLPAARRIRIAARDAGLGPTSMLGTETVARLLGLRLNHPQGSDDLELLPVAAGDAGRGGLLAGAGADADAGAGRLARPAQQHVRAAGARRLAARGARAGAPLRRVPVRLGRHVGGDPEALERNGARRLGDGARRLRLLGVRLARLQDAAVRRVRRCSATSSRAGRPTP